jgi:AraC-like DNA-binding protein
LEEAEEMMTQEEYMNVKALHAGGWTIKQIAEHLGFHPATVSSWLKNGGPPPKRSVPENELVIDERWRGRVAQLLAHNGDLQGSSIMRVIEAEGYEGSYQTLTRYLHSVRGPTRGAVAITMRIETMPGEEIKCGIPHLNSSPGGCSMSIVARPLTPAHASQCGRS